MNQAPTGSCFIVGPDYSIVFNRGVLVGTICLLIVSCVRVHRQFKWTRKCRCDATQRPNARATTQFSVAGALSPPNPLKIRWDAQAAATNFTAIRRVDKYEKGTNTNGPFRREWLPPPFH